MKKCRNPKTTSMAIRPMMIISNLRLQAPVSLDGLRVRAQAQGMQAHLKILTKIGWCYNASHARYVCVSVILHGPLCFLWKKACNKTNYACLQAKVMHMYTKGQGRLMREHSPCMVLFTEVIAKHINNLRQKAAYDVMQSIFIKRHHHFLLQNNY